MENEKIKGQGKMKKGEWKMEKTASKIVFSPKNRDEDPEFFSTDPDPAQLKKKSGSDLKSK